MKIPNKLKIGGHIYQVLLMDGEDIDKDCGEQSAVRNTIKIRKDMPQSQLEETLLHEIMHAINSGLKEELIAGLASSLYQVLKDNGLLK